MAIVAHYAEIALKGRNRSFFEKTLVENIKAALPSAKVRCVAGRLIIKNVEDGSRLSSVFGIGDFASAREVFRPTWESLEEAALLLASNESFNSFCVRARRGYSSFPHDSQEVNVRIGQALLDATGKGVSLSAPDWTCHIELTTDRAYLYSVKQPGPGGLPVGSSSKVLALLSGGIDSPVAGWQMAKRGAVVDFVHFHGEPYSDASSRLQVGRLADALASWLVSSKTWYIPFGAIQAEIVKVAPAHLRVVLYRRFMMRIAQALALQEGAKGLVTGESLGQVASQTLPNLNVTGVVVDTMPILRPLIGFDKLEIEAVAKRIGTYEISIQTHQDCCVLFIPKDVTTAAKLARVEVAEEELDVTGLVKQGLESARVG